MLQQALDHAHVYLLHHAQRFRALDELTGQHQIPVFLTHPYQDLAMYGA
jgi:hypothetical protein